MQVIPATASPNGSIAWLSLWQGLGRRHKPRLDGNEKRVKTGIVTPVIDDPTRIGSRGAVTPEQARRAGQSETDRNAGEIHPRLARQCNPRASARGADKIACANTEGIGNDHGQARWCAARRPRMYGARNAAPRKWHLIHCTLYRT